MRTVAILQARMNSTRLPGKMLLPLLDKPMVRHVIERVRRATKLDFVVLAYPLLDNPSFAPVLKSFTDTPGVPLGSWAHQGDEADLIERHLRAAEAYSADVIVRIPCDNPCVDPQYIDAAVEHWFSDLSPFITNTTAGCEGLWIDGIGAEVFSYNRLQWLDRFAQGRNPELREHIHKAFCAYLTQAQFRLDVNTQEDYERIRDIYEYFGHNQFPTHDVVHYLTTKEDSHESIQREQPSGNSQQGA